MSELDEAWAAALSEAERKARLAGRGEVAEYLALKNSNDLLRKAGIDWLLTEFTVQAGEANRAGASIQIAKQEGHKFGAGTSTMVGHLLTLTNGVRSLFVEAGWPRTPRDGFVRGGGLAAGNIRHLGIKRANEELLLARAQSGGPAWKSIEKNYFLLEADIRRHISVLLGQHH